MFNNTVFKKVKKSEELRFIVIETLNANIEIYKLNNRFSLSIKECSNLADSIIKDIENAKGMNDVCDLASKLTIYIKNLGHTYNFGYAIFIINLVFKKLAVFMNSQERNKLHAPLNERELKTINATSSGQIIDKMVKINNSAIYFEVIKQAKNYVKKNEPKFSSLYEWELHFWNNP